MKKIVCGIDPGVAGAFAFYNEDELMIHDMPIYKVKKRNMVNVAEVVNIIKYEMPDLVYIEKLTPLPGVSGLSAFGMGRSEGILETACAALKIPYTHVRPAQWKKKMVCPKDKDGARMRATQLLPQFADNWPLKKHDGRAEAALIALYGYNEISA